MGGGGGRGGLFIIMRRSFTPKQVRVGEAERFDGCEEGGGGRKGGRGGSITYLLASVFLKIELMEYDVRQLLLGARLV